MASLSLSVIEIIVLMLGAVILGITIYFFISTRLNFKAAPIENEKILKSLEEWKLRYFNDTESRDKELAVLRKQLEETEENNTINSIEADEMRKLNKKLRTEMEEFEKIKEENEINAIEADEMKKLSKKLQAEMELLKNENRDAQHSGAQELKIQNDTIRAELDRLKKEKEEAVVLHSKEKEDLLVQLSSLQSELKQLQTVQDAQLAEMERLRKETALQQERTPDAEPEKPDYLEQLSQAQKSFLEKNEKINLLLRQIDRVQESETKQQEMMKENEELVSQVGDLKQALSQKEKEIMNSRQQQQITREMTSMIDSAYSEFYVLQDKIQKLENQLTESRKLSLDYEDMKENHQRITHDLEDLKRKYNSVNAENKELLEELTQAEEKLREANFNRQQLQKRISYLEELNNDMQVVADANKKLESQLKRVAELESMLNMVSGEKNEQVKSSNP